MAIRCAAFVFLLAVASYPSYANAPDVEPVETGRTWLYLQDELLSSDELNHRLAQTFHSLTPRAQARRLKALGEPGVRPCDLLPSDERIATIESTGCHVVRALRYLNAVIVTGDEQAISRAQRLGFVATTRPVLAYASTNREFESGSLPTTLTDEASDYGNSYRQLANVNVPAAHSASFRGRGVLIGVQDTGFDNLNHNCFRSLHIIAAYDFLNNDRNVADQGDLGSGSHGTRTLSVIAGLDSGLYIGVAPDAQFVLTKTENSESENPIEEDYWVAGLWFHDSLGVDVLSSSLSYRNWYEYSELDGETAPTSRAADSAFAAGMILVNSMGNTGVSGYPTNKLGAPADARGVISVGGVMYDSSLWNSSSQGPTYDGRLKPDVSAPSSGVYTASTADDVNYYTRSGTSFACPIVAGVAALIVQANSDLTPAEVMGILHQTASQSNSPDTLTGYGIVNAFAAVQLAQARSVTVTPLLPVATRLSLFPNPTNGSVTVTLPSGDLSHPIYLIDPLGRRLGRFDTSSNRRFSLDLAQYPAGTYWVSVDGVSARLLLVR